MTPIWKLFSAIGSLLVRLSLLLVLIGAISNSISGGSNVVSNLIQHVLYFTVPASLLFFAKYQISLRDLLWSALFLALTAAGAIAALWIMSLVLYVLGHMEYPGAIARVPWWLVAVFIAAVLLALKSRTLRKKMFD